MRIQYLSDLHLESHAFTLKVRPDADVLVLAGDLAPAKHSARFEKLLTQTGDKPTVIIYGNHEFYNSRMEDTKKERRALCLRYPNIHLLDDSWVILNGVQFIGTTLWSDFKLPFTHQGLYRSDPTLAQAIAAQGISDFSRIAYNDRLLRPDDVALFHKQARHLIDVRYPSPWPTVVVSHFLPSPLSICPQFKSSTLNPYFASNCEDLMGGNVKAWIHGHTHGSCSYLVNGTRVACNPRGYNDSENPAFNSQATIDIEA